jgi:hypothetical protein
MDIPDLGACSLSGRVSAPHLIMELYFSVVIVPFTGAKNG